MRNHKLKTLQKLSPETAAEYQMLKHMTPSPKIQKAYATPIFNRPFATVTEIKEAAANNDVEALFKHFFGMSKRKFNRMRIVQFFQYMTILTSELEKLYQGENELSRLCDSELSETNTKKLQRFGIMNTIIPLAKDYSTPPQTVEQWQYSLVYGLTAYNLTIDAIQRNELKNHQNKTSL